MEKEYELTDKGRSYIERTMQELDEDVERYEADPENYIPHAMRAMQYMASNPMMRSYHIILEGLFRDLTIDEIYSQAPERYHSTMDKALAKAERERYIVSYTTDTSAFEAEFGDLF